VRGWHRIRRLRAIPLECNRRHRQTTSCRQGPREFSGQRRGQTSSSRSPVCSECSPRCAGRPTGRPLSPDSRRTADSAGARIVLLGSTSATNLSVNIKFQMVAVETDPGLRLDGFRRATLECADREFTGGASFRGDGKVHNNLSFHFDGLTVLVVGLIPPFSDCL
jgi:hypothetical protein